MIYINLNLSDSENSSKQFKFKRILENRRKSKRLESTDLVNTKDTFVKVGGLYAFVKE